MQMRAERELGGNATPDGREVWFESGGTKLFAVESGRGRAIIFLHGGLANHLAGLRVVDSLPSCPLSRRRHGNTPSDTRACSALHADGTHS